MLIASSSDGYCSIIHFEDGQLGEVYEKAAQINTDLNTLGTKEENSNDSKSLPTSIIESDMNAVDIDISKSKLDNSNENKIDSKSTEEMEVDNDKDVEETEDFQLILEDTVVEDDKPNGKATPTKTEKPPTILSRTPRRVQLITLSSPKRTKAE